MENINLQELREMIKQHGGTTKIFVAVQGSGINALCGVSPKYALEMCNDIAKFSNEELENINCDVEFQQFEMMVIHAIDA